MNPLREAAQQALEALRELLPLESDTNHGGHDARDVRNWRATLEALRAALAEPEDSAAELRRLHAQRDALLEALRALVRNEGLEPYSYLDKGIGTATAAGQRWLNARAAIAAVEQGETK